jgi:hypothetical protein
MDSAHRTKVTIVILAMSTEILVLFYPEHVVTVDSCHISFSHYNETLPLMSL